MNGVLLVDKPKDFTSRDVVNIVSKTLKIKKIGHTGTLDPFATGVLVLCVDKYTKMVEILTSYEKKYEASMTLGIETDTLDYTGKITNKKNTTIKKADIEKSLKLMTKTYMQEVPIYSAVKKDGKKLYEYAREGKDVVLPKKEVTIKKLKLISDISYHDGSTSFKVECLVSKGTYIRSLVRDLAYLLNTFGILTDLRRTKQGVFDIKDTYTIDEIKENQFQFVDDDLIFNQFDSVVVDEIIEEKIKNGALLDNKYNKEIILFKNKQQKKLALYKIYSKDPSKIKPWKMLDF